MDSKKQYMQNHKKETAGIVLAALGIAGFAILFHLLGNMDTRSVWGLGVLCNIPIAFALHFLTPAFLQRFYRDWLPENGDFYNEWKQKWRRQQRIALIVFIALMLLVVLFFNFMITNRWYFNYYNYAMAYLLMATVFLQSAVCELEIIGFMRKRLDMMMGKVMEINEERLAEAVEIERRSLEKAAKSEQLKVDLISNVSHDLKTPLTSMVGYLELLKKEELDDVSADYVEIILSKAEKLKEMIESLFSLAKASSGNIQIHPESVELNRLIEQIFADMDSQISGSGLYFVTSLTEEDTHLMTDNLHLYRICQNLIENALKYSAKGTRVFLKTFFADNMPGTDGLSRFNPERRLYFEITNTAGYFMDFNKEEIVERFARGDKARSSDGNGLGLAIVSTYASALGGAFDIAIDCDQFKATLSFPAETGSTGSLPEEEEQQSEVEVQQQSEEEKQQEEQQ